VCEALDQPQQVLMSGVTYEAMAAISSSATDKVSQQMNDLPKVVFSNTLDEPLAWKNTRLLRGDLADAIGRLKQQSGTALRAIGSITLVTGLMNLGLVDQLRLMVFPLTLGADGHDHAYVGLPRVGPGVEHAVHLADRATIVRDRAQRERADHRVEGCIPGTAAPWHLPRVGPRHAPAVGPGAARR